MLQDFFGKISLSRQRTILRFIILTGFSLTLVLCIWGWQLSLHEYNAKFSNDVEIRISAISVYLKNQMLDLEAFKRYVEGKGSFDWTSFHAFVKPMLERKGVQAVEWIPVVPLGKRAALEAAPAPNGIDNFRITERSANGALIPAAKRDVYYPVYYVDPLQGNEKAVGFDLGSNPQRVDAINAAINSRQPQATARITLVQEKGKQFGFLIFVPAYSSENLKGFALGVFRAGDMLDNAIRHANDKPPKLNTILNDLSAPPDAREIAKWINNSPAATNISKIKTLLFPLLKYDRTNQYAGRSWNISVSTTPEYLCENTTVTFLFILPVGLVITLLIAVYLNVVQTHRAKAELLVVKRTANLDRAKQLAEEKSLEAKAHGEMLRLILDSTAEGIYGIDVQGNCTFCNKACIDILGYDHEDDLLGKNMHDLIHHSYDDGTFFPVHECRIFKAFRLGKGTHVDNEVFWRKNGSSFPAEYWSFPQHIAGNIVGAVITFLDITDRKQAEMAMNHAMEAIEAANRHLEQRVQETVTELRQKDQMLISQSRQAAMGEMIGNIAHQWRQPINALAMLIANIQFAQQSNTLSDEFMNESAVTGNRLIQKMSTTINDFRNFFLPDKESLFFSAREQINSAIALVETAYKNQNIAIVTETGNDLMLKGLPNEYSQVLLNLLNNARDAILEYGTKDAKIVIRMCERDGFGYVSVSDNGGGIDAEVVDKIFEPYFSTKNMGTGIGLYMSKMIIEKSMNGTIKARNIDGGAEFTIAAPLERGIK